MSSKPSNSFLLWFEGISTMRREFWGIQALTFINATAFYLMFNMIAVYLNSDLKLEWAEIGWYGGFFAAMIASCSFFCGMLVDRIGFRNGMLIGATCSFFGRLGLGLLPYFSLHPPELRTYLVGVLALVAIGEAFLQPIVAAGTARFSSKEMRTKAFSTQVVMTQLGGGFLVALIIGTTWNKGESLSHLYLISSALSLLIPLVAYFFMKDESPATSSTDVPAQQNVSQKISSWKLIREIIREKPFWMIMLLLVLLMGTRMAFNLQGTLYIPYYVSTLGKKLDLGQLLLINPAIITLGLIFFNSTFDKIKSYHRLMLGTLIIASSVLVLAIPPSWLSGDISRAYFVMAVVQLIVFSIGEMIVSPALKQYILSLAPPEKLTSYAGAFSLSNIPTKFLPAVISGYLLARYCPKGVGERIQAGEIPYLESPQMMFVIMGVICVTGPVLLFAFRRWYNKG